MDRPENALEFVVLYFDDQPNLQTWVGGRPSGPTACATVPWPPPAPPVPRPPVPTLATLGWPPLAHVPLLPSLGRPFLRLTQGVVPNLLADITGIFPADWVFTTEDKAAFGPGWPSQQQVCAPAASLLPHASRTTGQKRRPAWRRLNTAVLRMRPMAPRVARLHLGG